LSDRFNIAWQKICCVLLRNFCHNNLVWSFSWFIRGLTFGLLMNFMSLNPSLIWLRMVMLAWPSNTIKSLRSVVHVALHSFLVHRHVLDDLASLWILCIYCSRIATQIYAGWNYGSNICVSLDVFWVGTTNIHLIKPWVTIRLHTFQTRDCTITHNSPVF
jgi:hypothetical protein